MLYTILPAVFPVAIPVTTFVFGIFVFNPLKKYVRLGILLKLVALALIPTNAVSLYGLLSSVICVKLNQVKLFTVFVAAVAVIRFIFMLTLELYVANGIIKSF